ncbi:hypothetical protein CHI08_15840 [Peribacillus simplex]|nr:hypothetical protein CHI08_15840 [Peribacillus simplex]
MKVMTILGTRPEIIRLSLIIKTRRFCGEAYSGAHRSKFHFFIKRNIRQQLEDARTAVFCHV